MSEYFVEVTPGRELVYQTPLSLRDAIRSGEITADSRIFHRATRTWISITEHPEYKRFRSEELYRPIPFDPSPHKPATVTAPPAGRQFLRSFADRGAALAASGWASLKKHFNSSARKPAAPKRPAKPSRPVPSVKPSPPVPQADPQTPDPTRKRWTFFP